MDLGKIDAIQATLKNYTCRGKNKSIHMSVSICLYICIYNNKTKQKSPCASPSSASLPSAETPGARNRKKASGVNQSESSTNWPPVTQSHPNCSSPPPQRAQRGPASGGVRLISRVRPEVRRRGRRGRKQRSWHRPSCQVGFLARFSLEMCIF